MADETVGLIAWLEERLRQERLDAELRHQGLINELRLQTKRPSNDLKAVPVLGPCKWEVAPKPMLQDPVESPRAEASSEDPTSALRQTDSSAVSTPSSSAAKKKKLAHDGASHAPDAGFLERIVLARSFELFFGALILLNALVIASEVQVFSYQLSSDVNWPGDTGRLSVENMGLAMLMFNILDIIFGALFWIELILKILHFKGTFFCSGWNIFDFVVMMAWSIGLVASNLVIVNPTLLRIGRMARVLRLMRVFHKYEMFDALVLMVGSIKASAWVLFWSTVLLSAIMLMCALILNSVLIEFIANGPDDKLVERQEVFGYFGSFLRSMVTMFEVTLGNWVPVCRKLMDEVTIWYGPLFIVYKLVVGFAVLKVISAIFLCETLKCASLDDDLMIQQKERLLKKFKKKMHMLFDEADTSGDGSISKDEFVEIVNFPRVKLWLQAMELNIQEPDKFFDMLDVSGDGDLDREEVITGMAKLKGGSTQLRLTQTEKKIDQVLGELDRQDARLLEIGRTRSRQVFV